MGENKTIEDIIKYVDDTYPELSANGKSSVCMQVYAKQKVMNAPVFRICEHCNTEFELTVENSLTERVSAFENCTHCNKRNDTWISIRV